MSGGLLIVNADDLGGNQLATDRILARYADRQITSATAMVHMVDAERAATLAMDTGLPVGLHLNLTQAYDAPDVPAAVAERQRRVALFLADPRRRRFGFSPRLMRTVQLVISDQLSAFRAIYRMEPTHIDGHNHGHLNPTSLAVLPRGVPVRPAHDPGSRRGLRALPFAVRNRVLAARHPGPERFFPLTAISPELGGSGLHAALQLAQDAAVEIMVHPDRDDTDAVLRSAAWRDAVSGLRVGSYADLPRSRRRWL